MSEEDLNVDLGLPRQRFTQPRRVETSMLVDDSAADLGKAVSDTVSAFNTRMQNIETSKNALTNFVSDLENQARSLDTLQDTTISDELQKQLMDQIDKINILGYNSIGRDQTQYIKESNNLVNATKNLLEGMLDFDEQGNLYKKTIESGNAANKISGSTPSANAEFMKDIMLTNGAKSKVAYENGAFIIDYNNGDVKLNASNYIDGRKKGAKGLISYVEDFNPSYKTSYDRILAKYTPLLKQVTKQDKATGKTIVTKSKEYNAIRGNIINELIADPNFAANVSQDEVQFLKGVGAVASDFEQADINKLNNDISTKRADYIAGLYLPKDQTLSETISPTPKPEEVVVEEKTLKINNDKFIASLNNITDVQTTGTTAKGTRKIGGIPKISDQKPENKGKIYENVDKNSPDFGKRYYWDGKKYIETTKRVDPLTIRKRKIEEVYKYLLRKNAKLLKNNESDIIKAFPDSDPEDRTTLYIPLTPKAGQDALNYKVIDLDSQFDDNILNSEEGLNNKLTEIIQNKPIL
tara:strand:- start:2769 stop:4337 length:1569 start_codon:yes stop_codon:yes gene_type:complete